MTCLLYPWLIWVRGNNNYSMCHTLFTLLVIWFVLLLTDRVQAEGCSAPLFTCQTDRSGKFVWICATEIEPGKRWSNIYYRFGMQGGEPELEYPTDQVAGETKLFFFHEQMGDDYRVTVRFTNHGYVYKIFSYSGLKQAGVLVSDLSGRVISTVNCIERPHMFPAYLRQALSCDVDNPHGSAACKEEPFVVMTR